MNPPRDPPRDPVKKFENIPGVPGAPGASAGRTRDPRTAGLGGIVRKIVKGYRVEAMDNKSNLRGLGMERLRESLIKTPLPFVVKGGEGTSSSTLVLLARVNLREWYAE